MAQTYYCKDGVYHYKSELPATLRPYVDYMFSSGGITGDDYISFQRKYKNYLNKILPDGYNIHSWNKNHYEFFPTEQGKARAFPYLSDNFHEQPP